MSQAELNRLTVVMDFAEGRLTARQAAQMRLRPTRNGIFPDPPVEFIVLSGLRSEPCTATLASFAGLRSQAVLFNSS
jgi:hypothetical protein